MTGPESNAIIPAPAAAVPIAPGETSSSAIAAREKAAVEARFLMALHRPRNFDQSRLRLLTACKRPKFAGVARYSKPVGKTKVHGLSVRFAEEARVLWGNIDVTTLLVFDDDERRIYRVTGTDLETNASEGVDILIEKFVERKVLRDGMEKIGQRVNTYGEIVFKVRATEDDLTVKVNAQIAKMRRNVILSVLPADVKDECEAQILATVAERDAKDPEGARKDILDAFWSLGVTPEQIVELLGKPLVQINPAELTLLRSYYTALKDGEAIWSEIADAHMGKATAKPTQNGSAGLTEALKKKAPEKEATDEEISAYDRETLRLEAEREKRK